MRLTLRTMLAYLDDILDPDDAQDIARRIDESEFATNVVHRTRDVMRRLRLGAPSLYDRGMSVDPNTVAEYLDNTLPSERVPDFEKVCLESDMHLAEAAACHQVLTLVLGEPAEVDPASRERMYGLIARPQPEAPAAADAPKSNGQPQPAAADRSKPEVPNYLRDAVATRRRWVWATAAVVLVCGGLVAAAIGWGDRDWLRNWVTRAPEGGGASVSPVDGDAAHGASLLSADVADEGPAEEPADDSEHPGDPALDPAADLMAAGNPQGVDLELEVPAGAADTDRPAAADVDADADDDPRPPVPADLAAIGGAVTDDAAAATDVAAHSGAEDGADEPTDAAVAAVDERPVPPPAADAAPAAANAESVGRFVSARTVLLRRNPAAGWEAMASLSGLSGGDTLVAPTSFRSTLVLRNGVTVQLLGDTAVELLPSDQQGRLGMRVRNGRAVLMTVGAEPVEMLLQAGDRSGLVTFADGSSELAVDVDGRLEPGSDPTLAPPRLAVELFATSGSVAWQDATSGETLVLVAPAQRRLDLPPLPADQQQPPSTIPDWIAARPLGQIDQAAAEAVEGHLAQPQRSVVLGLKELTQHRKREIRALAARCLGAIGQYEALVGVLSDPEQRPVWPQQIEALQAATSTGTDAATQVRNAFASVRQEDGPALFRMLWGYTADELTSAEATRLVEYLEHEDLDFRVLAIWNLHEITGAISSYRPEYPPARRQQYVLRWQQKLAAGEIAPRPAPTQ